MKHKYQRTTGTQRRQAERNRLLSRYVQMMPPSARHSVVAKIGKTSRSRPHTLRGQQIERKGERVWRGRQIYDAMLQRIGLPGL